jgi:hypothetical protein
MALCFGEDLADNSSGLSYGSLWGGGGGVFFFLIGKLHTHPVGL